MLQYKKLLMSAVAGTVLLTAGAVNAQNAGSGPYVMANGTRTSDYQAAIQSWRDDPQFSADYSKGYLGMEHAYARGFTGSGVTIGINDSGVYFDHPLFAGDGKIRGLDTGASANFANNGGVNPRMYWESHGTHVAGSTAGNRLENGRMFGTAYGANLYSASANFASGDFWGYRGALNNEGVGIAGNNLLGLASTGEVRIINNSWGPGSRTGVSDELRDVILQNDVLMVFSAGNGRGNFNNGIASAPAVRPDLRGNWLSVTNYQGDDRPSPSTTFCGQSATWCVSGPGHDILSGVYEQTGVDRAGIIALDRASYNAMIRGIESVDDIYQNASNLFLADINRYYTRFRTAQANGTPFDIAAERAALARRGAVLSMLAAAAVNPLTPGGAAFEIGVLLAIPNNVNLLGQEFTTALLTELDEQRFALIDQFFNYNGLGYGLNTGTSMSAPNISGFAAVLAQAFPEYSTALLTDIITSTSRDIDIAGVDIRTGWGVPQMGDALNGPSALRAVRDVNVAAGTVDIWSNDIVDARDRYSAQVLELNPDDIGGLTKIGGGELVLTGSVDYTGATRALGGLLTVDGSINRSEISVAETGIIGGIGALANLTAQEGGVVAPGNAANPFGTLTVTGNAVFQPGSYLWVRSAVNGVNYSKLNVGGTATLEGGNVIVKADQGNWNLRTRGMRILTADGGVTGTFDGVTSDLAFLKPTLTYEDNVVLLSLLRNDVKIASAGKTPNEQAVGGALDVMTSGTSTSGNLALEDAVLDGSLEAVSAALPYLTGEAHAALGGVATADSRIIRNAMLDRARTGSASIVEPVDGRGVYAWATGVFGQGEYDGSKDYRGFDIQSGGYVVGLDKAFERGHLGIAFAENKSELRGYDLATTADVRTRNIGLYAGLNSGAFNFRLGGAWTQSDVGTKRNVTLNAFSDQLIGDYEGDGWQAYAEVSWKAEARGTVFEPYANYAHVVYDADMKEIGGDAALSGTISEKADLITAGVRTRTALAGGEGGRPKLTLVGHLAWTENVNDDGPVFNARFADGPVFDVRAASLAGDSLTTGIGLNVEMNPRAAIDFGYSGNHGSDYTDNRLYGKLTVKF